jgi:hypothetical protein
VTAQLPTPERLCRGQVELVDRPIVDDHGAVSRPLPAIDILAAMERRGAISPEMRQAGEDFSAMLQRAGLDPLKAANMLPTTGGGQVDGVPFHMLAALAAGM